MHRATPQNTANRAYTAGGARKSVDSVDDSKNLQESKGNMMAQESRDRVESPQNYGFTSVVADADKDEKTGKIKDSAQAYVSFLGGSRSFPVAGVMDDPRHRLKNLGKDASKGATAMYGLKEWGQQMLIDAKGMFMTGSTERKLRFQLVKNKNNEQQQTGQQQQADAGGAGGQSGSGKGEQKKEKGQKTLHKEESDTFVDVTAGVIHQKRGNGQVALEDNQVMTYHKDEKKSTLAEKEHVHLRFNDFRLWIDKDGIWSTTPVQVKQDEQDKPPSTSGGGSGGDTGSTPAKPSPPVTTASPPMSVSDGNVAMAVASPLGISQPTPAVVAFGVTAEPQAATNGYLELRYADPLFVDSMGRLTSSGGSGGGIAEAPSDSKGYGRRNAAWAQVLLITGDVLDGGNF
jgi:phage gp45-like